MRAVVTRPDGAGPSVRSSPPRVHDMRGPGMWRTRYPGARAGGAWSMVRPRGRDTEIALSLTSAPRRGRAGRVRARPGVVGASCLETGECQ